MRDIRSMLGFVRQTLTHRAAHTSQQEYEDARIHVQSARACIGHAIRTTWAMSDVVLRTDCVPLHAERRVLRTCVVSTLKSYGRLAVWLERCLHSHDRQTIAL